ncbi:hypothetical protein ACFWPX_30150 [Nocardia sp. NPDC058518]|uniref:hypothetical protein n=1 Tax=Nocardia sp. NPDC058518 TaxID=3346534 RepID=UPI00364A8FC9
MSSIARNNQHRPRNTNPAESENMTEEFAPVPAHARYIVMGGDMQQHKPTEYNEMNNGHGVHRIQWRAKCG